MFFYSTGKRQVPINIYDIITPISLAYWIIDDGSKQNKGLHLNVYAFDSGSVERLLLVLRNKYNLICSIHYHSGNSPRIYIFQKSIPTLRLIVQEYIHESIYYKLGIFDKLIF